MNTDKIKGKQKEVICMTRFGEKVRDTRVALKLGQEQLGNLVGVSRRTIVSYETGGKYPRENTLRKLAQALGVTQFYLLHDEIDDPSAGIQEEPFIQEARDIYGKKGADELAKVLQANEALFAGGTLSEDQKDMFYEAITRAYFINKKRAREKFGRQKRDASNSAAMETATEGLRDVDMEALKTMDTNE